MTTKSRPTTAGTGTGVEEGSTRKRIQDVLSQAKAALRQSQQFRWTTSDNKNSKLSSRLAFQQQQQEDYWSSANAGEVIVEETVNPLYDGPRPHSKPAKSKSFFNQDDDFGLPFRDSLRKSAEPKILGSTRQQQRAEHKRDKDTASDSSSVTMNTADLKVSSDSEDVDSDESVTSLKKAPSKVSKVSKEVRIIEPPHKMNEAEPQASEVAVSEAPSTLRLTPLVSNPIPGEMNDDEDDPEKGSLPQHTTTVTVIPDDLGFSRATIKKPGEDPHWFEKALLVRGEAISEAAYDAFKKAQEEQEFLKNVGNLDPSKKASIGKKLGHNFPNPSMPLLPFPTSTSTVNSREPEFTADWVSDLDASEVDVPVSEYIQEDISAPSLFPEMDEQGDSTIPDLEEDGDNTIIDEAITESIVRTATELEASGILGEIANNLQNVWDVSDKPQTPDFSRMSAEERSFAREYDRVMLDKDEPLGAIFHSEKEKQKESPKDEEPISKSLTLSDAVGELHEEEEEEEEYENTFINPSSLSSSQKTKTNPTSTINTKSNETETRKSLNKSKSSIIGTNSTGTTSKSRKDKTKETSSLSKSKSKASTETTLTPSHPKEQSKTTAPTLHTAQSRVLRNKNKAETRTNRQITISRNPSQDVIPTPLDPPTNRYQKNIQTILEKEVFEKQLKKHRSDRAREDRKQEKLERLAKESLERNKKTTWSQPNPTEILLPELFKYKSISGLQAAKAKKSEHYRNQPAMNYGAFNFPLNAAAGTADEETAQILAKAQVESLDIPDLVREVLASNERMYRMTVEASREMNKVYKEKINRRR